MVLLPKRSPEETVSLVPCKPDFACLDKDNFKNLIKNKITTEAYIEELQNLLNTLADPIKP